MVVALQLKGVCKLITVLFNDTQAPTVFGAFLLSEPGFFRFKGL